MRWINPTGEKIILNGGKINHVGEKIIHISEKIHVEEKLSKDNYPCLWKNYPPWLNNYPFWWKNCPYSWISYPRGGSCWRMIIKLVKGVSALVNKLSLLADKSSKWWINYPRGDTLSTWWINILIYVLDNYLCGGYIIHVVDKLYTW